MKILMSRPDHFGIEYEINAWMHLENQVDKGRALAQWEHLYDVYQKLGVDIELIEQVEGLPDMMFTANAGICHRGVFLSGNFRHQERKDEEQHFQKWFADNGYEVKTLSNYQGGEGDALFWRGTLYMGYGFRSTTDAHKEVADTLDVPYESFELIDPYFYDFDTAFCPLGEKGFLYVPDALARESVERMGKLPGAVPISKELGEQFIGNSVYLDGVLLVGFLNDDLKRILDFLEVEPVLVDVSEFKKAGGGIKCLTLFLEH